MEKIGILGAGGQADEAESFLPPDSVAFRAISKEYIKEPSENKIDIASPEDYQKIVPVVAAIGAPEVRRKMVNEWPGQEYSTIIAEHAYVDRSSHIGEGSIIAPRAVITTGVEVGSHTIINVAATISHDCKLGNYVTVGPGAHIAGNVTIGDGAFIGIGAVISNNIFIAEGCVVGAGSVVIESINTPNTVVVGAPARSIRVNQGWLNEV